MLTVDVSIDLLDPSAGMDEQIRNQLYSTISRVVLWVKTEQTSRDKIWLRELSWRGRKTLEGEE